MADRAADNVTACGAARAERRALGSRRRSTGRRSATRRGAAVAVVGLLVALAACGGSDAEASSDTTAGPPTPEPTSYVVPPIADAAVAEICAGAADVVAADSEIGATLGPVLAQDSDPAADQALITALSTVKPMITRATDGYARMAAALPDSLAVDAKAVRDATVTFYDAVTAATSMDALIGTLQDAASFSAEVQQGAARLDATTRKVCNVSLYNAS